MSASALSSSRTLQSMKSRMSGWSMLRMTIFAARRVVPPDLITPASASNARMNETGPLAMPPPASFSWLPRSEERFEPVPLPPLNRRPSLVARARIESMSSATDWMKHAEHWGGSRTPTLNQTGLLNAAICWTMR